MKKLCLFDLDGTIIDPHKAITSGVQYALYDQGVIVTDLDELAPIFIGPPIRESFKMFKSSFTDQQIEQMVLKYMEYFENRGLKENKLYAGILDMLKRLKEEGHILTIATSKNMGNAIKIAKFLDFESYFELIIGCESDGTRSHKAEIIEYVLNKMGSRQDEYEPVMIGDRKYDIIGAKENGIKSIGVTWGYGSVEELQGEGSTHVVTSIEELQNLLLGEI